MTGPLQWARPNLIGGYGFGNPWRLTGHTFPGGGEPGDRAGCYAVTFAANATVRGIELSRLELKMRADFDLQCFLNLDDSVRHGAQEMRNVHTDSEVVSLTSRPNCAGTSRRGFPAGGFPTGSTSSPTGPPPR